MGSSVKLVTKDELTTGNYFNADNLIGGENTTIVKDGDVYKINTSATVSYPHIADSDKVTISVNGSSDTFAFTADNISSLNTLIANKESYLTQNVADGRYANKTDLNYKQDQLTADNAGNNITITGSGSTLKINAEATASYPHITDSDNVIISVEGTSDTFSFTSGNISALNTLVSNSGNYLTQSTADERYAKTADLSNKQDQLTSDNAGDNITITGSGSTLKINATGGTVSYPHITDSDNVTISVNGSGNTFSFTADNISSLNTLVSNSGNYLTQSAADERYAKTADLSNKQDQLTADNAGNNITIIGEGSALKINATASQYESGDGISIENNIISIADNGITSNKIADGAITGDEIADGSITSIKLSTAINGGRRRQLYYFK